MTLAVSARVRACGASVGGVAGVSSCSLEEHAEEIRKKWRVGVNTSLTSTSIRFTGSRVADETRENLLATLDYKPSRPWTLELGVGTLLGGHLALGGQRFDFQPGLSTTFATAFRLLAGDGAIPFVLFTEQASFATASTEQRGLAGAPRPRYSALDFRFGTAAGWTLFRALSPYVLARAFGGPVYWRYQGQSLTGTDTHHYQVGAGAALLIASRIDVFAEGVPLGERGASFGAGFAF